ncbi:DUF302 domain-containing protein [Lentilitoribacter sp. EG35]|jgi:uncharacterized protein (DUF302 family)|uniref:DUF302 domain-containing protein n=1 Tax=Lentilitoribacter sp. EG35 TaxID=3234192 RepID=UPI003460AB5E
MKKLLLALAITMTSFTAQASDLVTKISPHSVNDTMDRLVAAVEKAGATVFARVDHAKGAMSIDAELAPNQMLVFGNPKLGTPIMQQNPAAGLDLPIRVVVFQDTDGKTNVAYHNPSRIADDHGLPADFKALQMMGGAVDKLTGAATAE